MGGLTKGIELSRLRTDVRTMKLSPQKIRCLAPIKTIKAQESKTYAQSLNAFQALPVSPFRGQKVKRVRRKISLAKIAGKDHGTYIFIVREQVTRLNVFRF